MRSKYLSGLLMVQNRDKINVIMYRSSSILNTQKQYLDRLFPTSYNMILKKRQQKKKEKKKYFIKS